MQTKQSIPAFSLATHLLMTNGSSSEIAGMKVVTSSYSWERYYTAKNWCYSLEHEPLNELKQIQNRIDLSRSMLLLTFLAMQLLLLLLSAYLSTALSCILNMKT
jgi:hypothetical protein